MKLFCFCLVLEIGLFSLSLILKFSLFFWFYAFMKAVFMRVLRVRSLRSLAAFFDS